MLGIKSRRGHRRLEIKTQPLLNAKAPKLRAALRQVHEQNQVKHNGRGQNGIPTKKIHLDLHRVPEPAEDIDIVPALLVVATGWVIVYADFVSEIAVEIGVEFGLENVFENRELGFFLGLERSRIFEHFAVAVAQDVHGEPSVEANHARLEARGEDGLDQGLSSLEIFATDWGVVLSRQLVHYWNVHRQVR